MMRKLGKRLLRSLDAGFRSDKYVKSLDLIDFSNIDRLLFTFSYVSHQDTVTTADINQWVSLIQTAVTKVDRAVELIYTTAATAALPDGALPKARRKLALAGLLRRADPVMVQVQRRFPEFGQDGRLYWDEHSANWNVEAEHWVLRQ